MVQNSKSKKQSTFRKILCKGSLESLFVVVALMFFLRSMHAMVNCQNDLHVSKVACNVVVHPWS